MIGNPGGNHDKIESFADLGKSDKKVLTRGLNITKKQNKIAEAQVFYTIIEK